MGPFETTTLLTLPNVDICFEEGMETPFPEKGEDMGSFGDFGVSFGKPSEPEDKFAMESRLLLLLGSGGWTGSE